MKTPLKKSKELLQKLRDAGYTDEELAVYLHRSSNTIYRWRHCNFFPCWGDFQQLEKLPIPKKGE